VKNERPDLPLTIARLVRSATPVAPLAPPLVRMTRWTIAAAGLVLLSVVLLGVRVDVAPRMIDGWFIARAVATLAIVAVAAAVAFLISVPGVWPSRAARTLPVMAGVAWGVMLAAALAFAGSPWERLLLVQPHPMCVLQIVGIALLPGVALTRMLRRAAPLRRQWAGGLAGLATAALGALGAQFVCGDDTAAHHLLWHFTPVVLLALAGVAMGASVFAPPRAYGFEEDQQ
jgi:hypothetical protein